MTEEMKSFLGKLAKDEALQKKMEACKSPEEAFDVAKDAVDGLSFEDFTATMTRLNELITKKNNGELTDEDLVQVAGGDFDPNAFGFGFGIGAGVLIVAGGAAAAAI